MLRSTGQVQGGYYSLVSFQFPFLSLVLTSNPPPFKQHSKIGGCVAMIVFYFGNENPLSNKILNIRKDILVVHFLGSRLDPSFKIGFYN